MFSYKQHCFINSLQLEKLKEEVEKLALHPAEQKNIIQKYKADLEKEVILLPSNERIQHLKQSTLREMLCSARGMPRSATKLSAMRSQMQQDL